LVYLAKNSIKVIDNLAKTLASMEEKFDEAKKTVEIITKSAGKQLDSKDAQINFLKDKLEEMGVRTNETEQ
jgi:hypothetical protein